MKDRHKKISRDGPFPSKIRVHLVFILSLMSWIICLTTEVKGFSIRYPNKCFLQVSFNRHTTRSLSIMTNPKDDPKPHPFRRLLFPREQKGSRENSSHGISVFSHQSKNFESKVVKNLNQILPNWRDVSIHTSAQDPHLISPFTHKFNNSTHTHSIWSQEVYKDSLELYNSLMDCEDAYISAFLKNALHSLDNAFRLYGPENLVGSFNGGKDAVVILELMRAAQSKYYSDLIEKYNGTSLQDQISMIRPRVIYFSNSLEFPEVFEFVKETASNYDLDMIAFEEGTGFSSGLRHLVENNYKDGQMNNTLQILSRPDPMAFVLGTRNSDPNAGTQGAFAPSSSYMPPFMRVNPILDWSYGHVWHFLRLFKLPYCDLYDMGYTSLGNVDDTLPCPALKKNYGMDVSLHGVMCDYWPAYMLQDYTQERAGRINKKEAASELKTDMKDLRESLNASSVVNLLELLEGEKDGKEEIPKMDNMMESDKDTGIYYDDEASDDDLFCGSYEVSIVDPSINTIPSDELHTGGEPRTVGLIIIGDEILKGSIKETNSNYAINLMRERNVPLSRVVIVPDELDAIVSEIKSTSKLVDVIITSGGVGPTHDDITLKSVANALNSPLSYNFEMGSFLAKKMGIEDGGNRDNIRNSLSQSQLTMSMLPLCSKLHYFNGENEWPTLQCKNLFILPGVPQYFEKKVADLASYLSHSLERSVCFKVVLSIDETKIVSALDSVVERNPHVSIGSYPFVDAPFKTVVTLEGKLRSTGSSTGQITRRKSFVKEEVDLNVKSALSDLLNHLPADSVLRVEDNNILY